ncbi:MAG: hypothetical protein H0V17_24705, partial [Deltaproteobacteria bacterium]|nr:hypothetical protein [Deltaproteobacteria bacterium]
RDPFNDSRAAQRKYLAQAWTPKLADPVRSAARKLLASTEIEDQQQGAFMLEAVGLPTDAPALIEALTAATLRASRVAPETDAYPTPRGAMMELLRATKMLVSRGLVARPRPATLGELVVWLVALDGGARPGGWEVELGKLLKHDVSYLRELALTHAPNALPASLHPAVVANLGHTDVDVQVAAALLAANAKLVQLAPSVVNAMRRATGLRLSIISQAAYHLGARVDRIDMLIVRLADKAVFDHALSELCSVLAYDGRSMTNGKPTDAERAAVIPHWKKLAVTHRADIESGTKIALTAATPSLLPPQWKLGRPGGGGEWP